MNNIIISNDLLKKTLKKVKDVIDKKHVLPVLSNVLFKAKHDHVDIIVSDQEVTTIVTLKLEADNETEFEVLLPFELLNNISSISGSVPMQISTDGTNATIAANSDKYAVNGLASLSDYPTLPELPESEPLTLDKEFVIWLDSSIATISPDKLRPAMTKICLDVKDTALTIVTTDAQSMFTKAFEIPQHEAESLIISPKVAKTLSGLELIELSWNETHLVFKSEDIMILALRCVEKFPPFRKVIPKNSKANVEFNRSDLITALQKVSITAGSSSTAYIKLKQKIGSVIVESSDLDFGRSCSTELVADFDGNCERIAVNTKVFINLLNQVHFDYISLAITESSKPIMLSGQSDESYQGLIMPLLIP